jgi:hypothetical protein
LIPGPWGNIAFKKNKFSERAGIEPATDGVIRPLLVLKTSRNTSSNLSANQYNLFSGEISPLSAFQVLQKDGKHFRD